MDIDLMSSTIAEFEKRIDLYGRYDNTYSVVHGDIYWDASDLENKLYNKISGFMPDHERNQGHLGCIPKMSDMELRLFENNGNFGRGVLGNYNSEESRENNGANIRR